ncbi:hypothetical protein PSN_2951 [Pseudomonas sp. NGC7]
MHGVFPWADGGFWPASSALSRCSTDRCRCVGCSVATLEGPIGGGRLARTGLAKSPGIGVCAVISGVVHESVLKVNR